MIPHRRASAVAVLTVIAAAATASAQPEEHLEYLRLEDLMDIQVRVPSKLELRVRDAPTVGAAISREQIESYGWLSANDALFKQEFPQAGIIP